MGKIYVVSLMEASTHPARTDFLQPAKGRKRKKNGKKGEEKQKFTFKVMSNSVLVVRQYLFPFTLLIQLKTIHSYLIT